MRIPSRPRLISLATPVIVFAALFALLGGVNSATPNTGPPGVAVAELPAGATKGPTGRSIAGFRTAIAEDPANAGALAGLGDALYQRGRETADGRYPKLAGRAYDAALALDPMSVPALTGKATIALVAHDFPGGLALAQRANRLEPDLAATYPPLIDGLIETGRYGAAAGAIQRFLNLKPGPPAYARLSYFEELHGNTDAALRAMRLAAESALPGTEASAFGHALVGDLLFDAGRYGRAARSYETALVGNRGYVPAEAGLLNVAAATGNEDRAVAGYRELVNGRGLVEYSDELGRLEEAAGAGGAAARHYAAISELHAGELASGQRPDAGQVIFEADHGDPALGIELGRTVWKDSPSVSSADAYAWALHAAGRYDAARRISNEATRLGTRDPIFLFHAGIIAADAGEPQRARSLLRELLATAPGFDPLFARDARRELRRLR